MKKSWLPHPYIWLSYILLVLTFEPFNLNFLAFVALVPFLEALYQCPTKKKALTHSLWLAWLFSVTSFFWVAYVVSQFGQAPWIIGVLALILFGFVGQPQFVIGAPLFFMILKKTGEHPSRPFKIILGGLTFSFLYSGLDWLLPKLFVDTLGHASIGMPYFKQMADLGGPSLITFVMVLVNFAIWDLVSRLRRRGEPALSSALSLSLPLLILALGTSGGFWIYGVQRLKTIEEKLTHPKKTLQAAVIQANIGDIEKIASEKGFRNAAQNVMRTFYDMSDEALHLAQKPEIIIWPETSYPSAFHAPDHSEDFARDQELENFVKTRGVPLVFGGYAEDEKKLTYNAVFYLEPNGRVQTYYKTILLMFGEYIPGADWIPGIKSAFPMVGYFGRGPGSVIREVSGIKTQPVICYEVLFPNFIADAVRLGAEVILNVTNDSWFGLHGAPYHHLNLSSFRSIETRTSQIRATNTGFSALILPTGEMIERTELFKPQIMNVNAPVIDLPPTLITRYGDWFAKTAFGLGLIGTLILRRKRF
jgi:apolipoprotein N-acyltransferase